MVILETGQPLQVSNALHTVSHRGGFVAGIHDGPTRTSHEGHQAGIQLNLPPLVARQLFGLPLGEIANQVIGAIDLIPGSRRADVRRIAEMQSWGDRLDVVEALLTGLLEQPLPRGYRELTWAISRIEMSGGSVSIRATAQALGWSDRRLQRAFTERVGVASKVFARLVRFDARMTRVQTHPEERWVDQAIELGFADQSHMVRDVRQFTGVTSSLAGQRLSLVAPLRD